ncbi:hypothetical protein [Sphingomonas sp. Leaf28]|nr:hypothetical protein [Sphingomonas sp. Leaf28]
MLDFGDEDCFERFGVSDLNERFEAPDIDIIIQNNLAEIIIIRT